jgi:hypothetical protein
MHKEAAFSGGFFDVSTCGALPNTLKVNNILKISKLTTLTRSKAALATGSLLTP